MSSFAVFILSHGRADRVYTYDLLVKSGYSGKIYIVIDDEDPSGPEYRERFGDGVLTFSKRKEAKTTDAGDNFNDLRCVVYARNACFDLARSVGCDYFAQLDDDYVTFEYRYAVGEKMMTKPIARMDEVFSSLTTLYRSIPAASIAMPQGGDYIGGTKDSNIKRGYKRKVMNSFIFSTAKPVKFYGSINEDTSLYTCGGRKGELYLTVYGVMLRQKKTQSNDGGLTDIYQHRGTYVKSFYSVMYAPSCVKIAVMGAFNPRIHHRVKWDKCAPKIVHERHRKAA